MISNSLQIPYPNYQNLLNHLQAHALTDGWAASPLDELKKEAKLVRISDRSPPGGRVGAGVVKVIGDHREPQSPKGDRPYRR